MRVFLGFDGGGTKTECVVLDKSTRLIGRAKAGASNPTRVGFESAAAAVQHAAALALADARAAQERVSGFVLTSPDIKDVASLCAGLAGTAAPENKSRMQDLLVAAFPGALVHILTDLELALAAMNDGPAIVLVAGTGSAAVGRDAQGNIVRAGGYGRDVSDEGSAYDIGRIAIADAAEVRARKGQDSPLAHQILRQLGCAGWDEVAERIAADRDAVYPRVFPVVAAAADAGDASAQELLSAAAEKLATLVGNLASQLGLDSQPFELAKTGGMIGRSSYFDEALSTRLSKIVPGALPSTLLLAPAEAAARIALRLSEKRQRGAG